MDTWMLKNGPLQILTSLLLRDLKLADLHTGRNVDNTPCDVCQERLDEVCVHLARHVLHIDHHHEEGDGEAHQWVHAKVRSTLCKEPSPKMLVMHEFPIIPSQNNQSGLNNNSGNCVKKLTMRHSTMSKN